MTQGLCPLPRQLTRYQSILGLYGALLPRRSRGAVVRPLEALLPMHLKLCPLRSQGVFGGAAQL
jgi:hypothetical protein